MLLPTKLIYLTRYFGRGTTRFHKKKAESLIINSIGQRPMKQKASIAKPRRGVIDHINVKK